MLGLLACNIFTAIESREVRKANQWFQQSALIITKHDNLMSEFITQDEDRLYEYLKFQVNYNTHPPTPPTR